RPPCKKTPRRKPSIQPHDANRLFTARGAKAPLQLIQAALHVVPQAAELLQLVLGGLALQVQDRAVQKADFALLPLSELSHHAAELFEEIHELVALAERERNPIVPVAELTELLLHLVDGASHPVRDDDSREADTHHEQREQHDEGS